ncbi:wax ester/triacylglycerol synthase family O-acyltransferase [Marinobacter sp. VGCF2001]|uniref:wax ester/triacylglycerol synthase family O-acyltransferase n=1 Tax=Marinobacter sp. VGCF2001 TaxID=3417189 RepID=UPI003CF1EFDF
MTPKRTAMSSVDRSWLRMDTTENPMVISTVLVFEQPIPLKRLKRTLEERFLKFRRFRQRVIDKGDSVFWEDDPLFDLDNHLHSIALPGNGDKGELQALASDLNSTALDYRRPLWQIHYIDNYKGGCALLIRIHHCIADGISLVRVMLSLTDRTAEPRLERVTHPATSAKRQRTRTGRFLHRMVDSTQAAWEQAGLFVDSIRKEPDYPVKLATTAAGIVIDLAKLGLAPFEPKTSLKSTLVGRKRVAWAEPIELEAVKQCARALGGTVNDVLLCAATGALSRHFTEHDQAIPDCGIRVAVPFNLRPLDQPIETLGNQFGLVLVCLPVEVTDPVMCFHQVQENMNRLKRSYQAQVTYSLLDLFGRGPDILERRALALLSNKASAVLTNVPGPRHAVYLAGSKLVQPMFWVPQSGNIGIGMSIFSYAGTVQFGITVDKGIQAEPAAVMDYFHDSFWQLYRAAMAQADVNALRHAS